MSRIKIKNFGPIKDGCTENDGWIDIKKVTLFIGNQGSGKSTVAKLISTLSWLEKAMVKGIMQPSSMFSRKQFEKYLAYQKLGNYLNKGSIIHYIGNAFEFKFNGDILMIYKNENNGYLMPKIMYVPAERNFLSVVDRPDKLRNLPATLYTFNDEYDLAKNKYASGVELPINGTKFVYDKLNKIAHIFDNQKGYRLRLSEASSGFHSTVPLYLTTKFLTEELQKEEDVSKKENSLEDERKLEKEIKQILDDKSLTPDVRQAYLRQLSAKRKPACFINIVEEPELNLFPKSQKEVLFSLVQHANKDEGNKLIMTTHSPYFINYLTLAVKAFNVKQSLTDSAAIEKVAAIVPIASTVNPDDLVIYQLDEVSGTITKLADYKGLPSDDNYLNDSLGETNELFAQLLEIEKGWQ
jgi:predicted ATPase